MGIVGRVEVFEVGDGFLFAAGWLGPDLAGSGRPVPDLVASAGSAELGRAALTALVRRDDLPEGAQSFHAVLHTAGRVAAFPTLAAWSGGRTMPLEAVPPRPFVPRGHLDRADGDAVEGWLFDPGAALAGGRPVLVVDGRHVAALELDQPRPDLPFPTPAAGGYGFHLRLAHLARLLAGSDPGFAPLDGHPHGLALVSSGQAVAYAVLQAGSAATGRLERVAAGVLVGWVADRPGPEGQPPAAEILLDGVRYWTASATEMRPDLPSAGPGQVARGLRVALPNPLPDEGAGRVTLRIPGTGVDLPGAAALDTPTIRPDLGRVLETLPEPGSSGISVVVPVHDAPLPLEACLEALAQHTTCPARLLLLDDASADPRVAEILARWAARPGVAVHRNATNLGFAGTCNRGFALAGRDDVVLLNADTEVGPGWLEGLRLAAYASRATGTATAVSDHAGPFSVPEPYLRNARPPGFAAADLARLVRQASPALLPVVPTGHGFCLYLRRDCLDQVGGFDAAAFPRGYGEENDFCLRAGRAGWVHRVDDRTWVRHHGGTSFGTARAALQEAGQAVLEARYPEYPHLTATLDDDPGLLALRWRVRRALGAARGAPRRGCCSCSPPAPAARRRPTAT